MQTARQNRKVIQCICGLCRILYLLKVSLNHFIWLKVLLSCEHVMKTVCAKVEGRYVGLVLESFCPFM